MENKLHLYGTYYLKNNKLERFYSSKCEKIVSEVYFTITTTPTTPPDYEFIFYKHKGPDYWDHEILFQSSKYEDTCYMFAEFVEYRLREYKHKQREEKLKRILK